MPWPPMDCLLMLSMRHLIRQTLAVSGSQRSPPAKLPAGEEPHKPGLHWYTFRFSHLHSLKESCREAVMFSSSPNKT